MIYIKIYCIIIHNKKIIFINIYLKKDQISNLKRQRQSESMIDDVKVVIIGSMGVGKSSLVIRYTLNSFNQYMQSNLGAAYFQRLHNNQNGKTIKFQLWDTAGQERYKSIAKIYYKDSKVAIAVYDVTRKDSFQGLQVWIKQLRASGPENIVLAIVGNKIDLLGKSKQQVDYGIAKQYAEHQGAIFKCVSAKQSKGINELFDSIAQRYQIQNNQYALSNSKQSKSDLRAKIKSQKHRQNQKKCCQK